MNKMGSPATQTLLPGGFHGIMNRRYRRGCEMKTFLTAAAAALCLAQAASGTNVGQHEFECPICGEKFQSTVVESYSAGGYDEEGRPRSIGEDIMEYQIHTCPKCGYSAFGGGFGEGEMTPKGDQVRATAAALKTLRPKLGPGELWPLEKIRLAEACLIAQKAPPEKLKPLYKLGAWLADDAGEDGLAEDYREKVLNIRLAQASFKDASLPADYREFMRAYWAGIDQDAQKIAERIGDRLWKECQPGMEAARKAGRDVWFRVVEPNETPPPDNSNVCYELSERELAEATEAERQAIAKGDLIEGLREQFNWLKFRVKLRLAGEAKATEIVRGQGFEQRAEYIHMYGLSKDPNTVAGIKELIANSFGPETRPARCPEEEWKRRVENYSARLQMVLYRAEEGATAMPGPFRKDSPGSSAEEAARWIRDHDKDGAITAHLDRPCWLEVKIAMARSAGLVDALGLEKALVRWSKSRNAILAREAKAGLVRLKGQGAQAKPATKPAAPKE
jgi:hypothetical protein